jgi:hypothetical protein
MQKKIYTLLCTALLFTGYLHAQYIEAGIFAGVGGYNGDLSHKLIHINELHPATGISISTPITDRFSISLASTFTTVSGNDDNADKPAFQARNLSFRSKLFTAGLHLHYYITGYNPLHNKYFSPYVTSGISYFHFNPTAAYDGVTYALQPLGTEGQGTSAFPDRQPYALHAVSIPMGVGIKYALSKQWNIAFDVIANKTFTDYLDDVSTTYVDAATLISENGSLSYELSNRTDEFLASEPLPYDETQPRGNPHFKDWFGTAGFVISYNILPARYAKPGSAGIQCPEF